MADTTKPKSTWTSTEAVSSGTALAGLMYLAVEALNVGNDVIGVAAIATIGCVTMWYAALRTEVKTTKKED